MTPRKVCTSLRDPARSYIRHAHYPVEAFANNVQLTLKSADLSQIAEVEHELLTSR